MSIEHESLRWSNHLRYDSRLNHIYIFLTPLAIRSENICVCAINDKLKAINWCVFVSCSETISCSLPLFSIDRTACRQINGLRRSENFVDLFFLSLIFFGWNIRFTHKPTDEINHKKNVIMRTKEKKISRCKLPAARKVRTVNQKNHTHLVERKTAKGRWLERNKRKKWRRQ